MRGFVRVFAVATLVAWAAARADGPDGDAAPAPARPVAPVAASPPAVDEVGPEIFYLQDDAGRLVPVPGFRYRDFLELFRLREGLPAALEPPAVVLESIVVRADLARGDAAAGTCPAVVECVVRQTRAGWARVPLALEGLVLSAPPRHDGPGRAVVDADPDGGYRGWFDAPPGAADVRHSVVLEGTLPADVSADRDTLSVLLPSATSATVEVRSSRAAPDVAVVPPPPGLPTVVRQADGGSIVSVAGVAGPLRIRLAAAGAAGDAWEAVPQAVVESVVRIDGRTALIDAAIRLENLRPGTATIDVALPPRSVLRGVRPPATLVGRGGTPDAPTATVAVERGRDGRAAVEIECERPVDPSGATTLEAIGFAVAQVESWRQWGRVSLVVEGDWRAEWADRPGVRRVDPPPAARRPGLVAAFAYDALPASLPVRVRPRVSRVVIEPEYRYQVGPTRVTLAATLRVAARGAPATSVTLEVDPSFDVDEVGPPGVVDATAVAIEGGRVTIPFVQPLAGDAVVEVRGVRWVDREAPSLAWQLPQPRADVVAPALVVVTADADIELMPDAAACAGLVRQVAGGRARADSDRALVYRLDGPSGGFGATRRFLARRVDAAVEARATIDEAGTEVVEEILLDVSHVALEYVEFEVPAGVAEAGTLEVRQAAVSLDPFVVPRQDAAAGIDDALRGPDAVLVRAVLAEPLLGRGDVTVSFRVPTPTVPPETTVAVDLPLVLPAGATLERQAVVLEPADRLSVEVRGDGWRVGADAGADDRLRRWTAARPQGSVPLAIAARPQAAVDAVVEAAWLRTTVLPDRREDVATYVLSGGGEPATIAVPFAADTVSCAVTLDGGPLPATRDAAGRFAVTLPRPASGRRHVVEVRTTAARLSGWAALGARLGLPERIRLDPPEFASGVAERRFYWEIVARPDEHVFGAPPAWTPQQRWRVDGAGFVRVPAVEPGALAAWIRDAAGGAGPAAVEPPLVASRAVYSGVGAPGAAAIWLVPTWCAVLAASGLALAAGLALAYVAAARRPAVVVPVVAATALAAAALPDVAPLAAQAALPGVGLSLVAWALRVLLDRGPGPAAARAAAAAVSASSLTRVAPSLLLPVSSPGREGSVTTGGRSQP